MKKTLFVLLATLFSAQISFGQVGTNFIFSQSNGAYTDLGTSGTQIAIATANSGATGLDDVVWPIADGTIPFDFIFDGNVYTGCRVSSNGFITFGTTAPATNYYTPLSGITAYKGAISPWGGDLSGMFNLGGKTSEVRYAVVGSSPNREFVIQWKDFRPSYSSSTALAPYINFQIRLAETSNAIKIVYGPSGMAAGSTNTSAARQIGLRGSSNAFPSNVINRTNTTSQLFTASTPGIANSSTQNFSTVNPTPGMPTDGLTYTFTIATCFAPSNLDATNIQQTTATISWTAASPAPANGYVWEVRTSGDGGSGATGLAASGTTAAGVTTANVSGLLAATNYNLYVRSSCGGGDFSSWAGPKAFATACGVASIPYSQDFESVTPPALPVCTQVVQGGTGNLWVTAANPGYGFTTKALRYSYNSTNNANTWFFTNGIQLTGGTEYQLSYDYGNTGAYYPEKMKVAYGNDATIAAMTNVLADHSNINQGALQTNSVIFKPTTSGVYYLGFQAYSDKDQFYLFLDNILLKLPPPPCAAPAAQPTALVLTPASDAVNGSYTASATATGYLVVQSTSATLGATPENKTSYTVGQAFGSGKVVKFGAGTTFSATGLEGSTKYYYFIFAYATGDDCSGPIYRTASPLTGNTTTLPAAPASFVATATTATQISFTATPNAANNSIVVAWNTSNTFGNPSGALAAGQDLPGGGKVHYVGPASGLYSHSNLSPGTTYYYRAWSVATGLVYSTTYLNSNTSTPFGVPFSQNFDSSPTGATPPAGWTSYASATGTNARPWTIATNVGAYSAPNSIVVYYHESNAKNEWLVSPPISLTAGQPYKIKFWVQAPGWATDPERLKLHVANSPALASISSGTKIWDGNNLALASFTEIVANYTPATSGLYYFGWHAYSIANVDYIAMDNISIVEQPPLEFSPEAYDFKEINAGFQSTPKQFTIKNNRQTAITISGINLTGADASQFVKIDNNTYPKTLASGAEATVSVYFKPTSTGAKTASLTLTDNFGSHSASLSGSGYLNGPQLLTATPVVPTSVQLNWNAPLPQYEIRYDDNSVEGWYWLSSPSSTDHLFYTKIVIPANGVVNKFGVLARSNGATTFQSVRFCPDNAGKPNLTAPIQAFNNVAVTSGTGDWLLFDLSTPLNVTAGQVFYIVTQWPAGSTVGPYVGADEDSGAMGMCAYSSNGGTAYTNFPFNFLMRAFMSTGAKSAELPGFVAVGGSEQLAGLPVMTLGSRASENLISRTAQSLSVEAPGFMVKDAQQRAPGDLTYTVKRKTGTADYSVVAQNVQTTNYLDASTTGATQYTYQVDAVYPAGAGPSNEVVVATLCLPAEVPFSEPFAGSNPPLCWKQTYSGTLTEGVWGYSNSSYAGGSPYEMAAGWQSGVGITRLISPGINTQGLSQLTLSFRHFYDGYATGITYKVQTSSDGTNWTDTQWVNAGSGVDAGPEMVYLNLTGNLGATTYIAWVLDGDHYQFNDWYIDDVQLSLAMEVTASSTDLTCYNSNDGAIQLTLTGGMPPFTFAWQGPNGFTSDQQNLTGLAAGSYYYSVTDGNGTVGSGLVVLSQPAQIPAPNIQSLTLTYDGMEHSVVAGTAPSNGPQYELVWYDAATGGSFTSAPRATNAGVYTAWAANREIAAQPSVATLCESARVEVTLTINKKGLTVTADNKQRCQFEPNPELSFSYNGFVNGEDAESLTVQPTISTTAIENSAPGTYPITLGGGESPNYAFTYVNATLTVVRSPQVYAGPDGAVCISESFPIVGATASNYTTIKWTTSGNGTFSNATIVNPVYNPGSADIASGSVVLTLTGDPGSTCSKESEMTLTLQNDLPVSVAIQQLTETVCVGTEVEFKALPTNGGLTPSYQWKVNGVNAGTNSELFAYIPANDDVVTVVLTSSIGCALNNPATSAPFVVAVTPDLIAGVTITASELSVCDDTQVTFTADPVNGGSNPAYQWKVNGLNLGLNSPIFTHIPLDGDEVFVVMTSNHPCAVEPIATSNTIQMEVMPPYLEVFANPANGGTVTGTGNYAVGTVVTVVATPTPGWEFLNWKDESGAILSTDPSFEFTIAECYEALYATFSSTAKIAGQLKYFNANETIIQSPNNYGVFYVQLFEGENPIGERKLVAYDPETGLQSYFEYIGVESGKDYTLRVWEEATNNKLGNVWSWNNWGGATSTDALIISFMTTNNSTLTQLPWIATTAGNYTPYFSKVADINNSNSLSAVDALVLQYAIAGTPGYKPLPGGAHNFRLATRKLADHSLKNYPTAPGILFEAHGEYNASANAAEVYYEALLTNLNDGLNVFNIYFVATGDLNVSYVPGAGAKAGQSLAYNGVINVQANEEVMIPVKVDQAINLGAVSLGFSYDPSRIQILDVPGYPVHYNDQTNGTLRISWFDQNGMQLNADDNLMLVKAKVLADLHEGEAYFTLLEGTEFADVNASIIQIGLSSPYIETGVTGINEMNNMTLSHMVSPNPFKQSTRIDYVLPEAGKVSIKVYNYFGQEVKTLLEAEQLAGGQSLILNNYELRDAGQYVYRITLEGRLKTWSARGTIVFVK